MAIITKFGGEKKPDKQPLVVETTDVEKGSKLAIGVPNEERHYYILRTRAKRLSSASTLCLLVTALLVMTVGLFGGLYFYRQMTRVHYQKLWCKIPYPDANARRLFRANEGDNGDSAPIFNIPQMFGNDGLNKIDDDGLSYLFGDDPKADAYFRENFELDTEYEKFSKVDVPDFKNGRMGRFIHEFNSNKTAIVDQSTNRCFIMPLDREHISPPKSMFDMLEKMSSGYYSVNTRRIRETMRVVLPALENLDDLGEYIREECKDKTSYRLEKSTGRVIKKRSVEEIAVDGENKPYAEFGGSDAVMEYFIENLDELP